MVEVMVVPKLLLLVLTVVENGVRHTSGGAHGRKKQN